MRISKFLIALLLLSSATVASAAVIYDESIDGDFGNAGGGSPTIFLDLGVNSIIGIASNGDVDDFIVEAMDNLEITGGVFTAFFDGSIDGFYNSNAIPVAGGGIFQDEISGDLSIDILAFDLGLFRIQSGSTDSEVSYQFDFTVVDPNAEEVNSPATLVIFLITFIALFRARAQYKAN